MKLFDHFLTEYSYVWVKICRVSSQILLGFFHKISTRNSFWKRFQKHVALQGAPLSRFVKFCPNFYNFILSSYCAKMFRKHLHKYFHLSFVSSQRGTSKKKTQKNIEGRKAKTFYFRKKNKFSSFVCSRSGIYYALFLGCFDLKFLRDIPYCVYWVVAEIWASNSFPKIWNQYFIRHCHDWKESSYLCEIVVSFSNWILVRFSWNLLRFIPNSVGILPKDFNKKFFLENVPKTSCTLRHSSFQICEILP